MGYQPRPPEEKGGRPDWADKSFPLLCRLFGHFEGSYRGELFCVDLKDQGKVWFREKQCSWCESFYVVETKAPLKPPAFNCYIYCCPPPKEIKP